MIISPNVDFVPEPHIFGDKDLQPRADGRFGLVDCFQWPQLYNRDYQYSVCIPRKDTIPSLAVVWYDLTRGDFVVPTGSKSMVGMLHDTVVKKFEHLLQLLCGHHHCLQGQTAAMEILSARISSAQHEVLRLRHHPLVFRDLVAFVVQVQRTLLDIHVLLDFIEILHPLLVSPPSKPVSTNPTWMGCFMKDTQICEVLYLAGVPVWLVRDEQFIPQTMNIIHPVQLTCPDNIVRAMYSENGAVKSFPVIYRGPSDICHHYHSCRPYEGTLAEQPEPIAGPSAAHPISDGGKHVTQKQARTARVKAATPYMKGVYLLDLFFLVPDQAAVSLHQGSVGAKAKRKEVNPLDIPDPHSIFKLAWEKVDKNLQQCKSGFVDPGYHFPKPCLFVGVGLLE